MRAEESDFRAWFNAQFGGQPSALPVSDAELQAMVRLGKRAQCEIDLREIRFAQEQAALYAWNARGKKDAP